MKEGLSPPSPFVIKSRLSATICISTSYTQHPIVCETRSAALCQFFKEEEKNQFTEMAKLLFGLVACVAAFVVVDSLTCNKCSLSVFGFCLSGGTETCAANNTCFTGRITTPSISSFNGFSQLGCREMAGCNATTNSTLLSVTFTSTITCCSTDRCNNAATSTKMTFSAVIGAAVLASVLGSIPL